MADPEDWGAVRNVDHIEAALIEERRKFQQETLRTSELSALLKRFADKHRHQHTPGPWSRGCDLCALVGEADELLGKPINTDGVPPKENDDVR